MEQGQEIPDRKSNLLHLLTADAEKRYTKRSTLGLLLTIYS